MIKFGLARPVRSVKGKGLVLSPFSDDILIPADKHGKNFLVGVDCSWNLADDSFFNNLGGIKRRLPPLLAGNPVNYSKIGKLTTAEALSASLFILGLQSQALSLLDKFKWGHTFYELNQNLLEEYSGMQSQDEADEIARQYGLG